MSQHNLLTNLSIKSTRTKETASRGQKRRLELIASAEEIFIKNGYKNSTIDDIATHANASKSTLYKFFGNKEELFSEIIRIRTPDLKSITQKIIQPNNTIRQTLEEWGLTILLLITTPDSIALYKTLLAEIPWHPALGKLYYEQGPKSAQYYIASYFHDATLKKELICKNPELAANLFISMIVGDPFGRALLGLIDDDWNKTSAKQHVEEAVAIFLSRYKSNN